MTAPFMTNYKTTTQCLTTWHRMVYANCWKTSTSTNAY